MENESLTPEVSAIPGIDAPKEPVKDPKEKKSTSKIPGMAPVKPPVSKIPGLEYTAPSSYNQKAFKGPSYIAGIADHHSKNDMHGRNSYAAYGVTLNPYADWDEARAKRQSTTEKWVRGLSKAAVTTVGAVAENTAGLLAGVGESLYHQDVTKLYDNHVGRFIDSTNEYAREFAPNFYTKDEREHTRVFSANFWADKAANGFGYSLGSILSVMATGGMGTISLGARALQVGAKGLKATAAVAKGVKATTAVTKGIGTAAKATTVGSKAANIYNGTKKILTGMDSFKAIKGTGGALRQAAQRAKVIAQQGELGLMMSWAESSVEARESLRSIEKTELEFEAQEESKKLGKEVSVENLSDEGKAKALDRASYAANVVFGTNLAVLSFTNMITLKGVLSPKYMPKSKSFRNVSFDAKAGKWVDKFADSPKWKKLAINATNKLVKPGISEAAQEGTQYATQVAGEDLAANKRNGESNTIKDWSEAMVHGFGETYGSKDGREAMLLGAIIGIATGGLGSIKNGKAERETLDKNTQEILRMKNNSHIKNAQNKAVGARQAEKAMEDMQTALTLPERDAQGRFTGKVGDHKKYRDAHARLIQSQALMHIELGSIDMYRQRIADTREMSDEAFKEEFGIEDGVLFDKNKIVDSALKNIDNFIDIHNRVEARFPTPTKTGGVLKSLMSKEAIEEENARIDSHQYYKRAVYNNMAILEDVDKRIESLRNDVNEGLSSAGFSKKDFLLTEESTKGVQEKIEKAEEELQRLKITDPEKAEMLETALQDLVSLAGDRAQAADALNNLFKAPEERNLYIQKMKANERAAAQKITDQEAKDAIENSVGIKDLEEIIKSHPNASKEQQDSMRHLLRQRQDQAFKIKEEADTKSVAELQEQLNNSTNELEKEILEKEIEVRTQANELEPKIVKPSPEEESNTEITDKEISDEIRRRQIEEDREFDVTTNEEREQVRKDLEAEQYIKNAQDKGAIPSESESAITVSGIEGTLKGVSFQYELIQLDANGNRLSKFERGIPYKLILDKNGLPIANEEFTKRFPGLPPVNFKHKHKNSKVDVEVTYELIEYNETDSDPKLAQIAIKHEGEIIGYIASNQYGDNSAREQLYEKLINGENVVGKVAKMSGAVGAGISNYNNTVTLQEDGTYKPVFRTVIKMFEGAEDQPAIMLVVKTGSVWDTKEGVQFPEGMSEEDIQGITNLLQRGENISNLGQLFTIVKDPEGNYRLAKLSTSNLIKADQVTALNLLLQNTKEAASELKELAGIGDYAAGKKLFIEDDLKDGNVVINIDLGNGVIGQFTADNLAEGLEKGMANIPVTFGQYSTEADVNTNSTRQVFKAQTFPVETQEQVKKLLEGDFKGYLEKTIAGLKYQIDAARMNTPGYLEELSQPLEEGGPSKLQSDMIYLEGSFFSAIGINTLVDTNTEDVINNIIVPEPGIDPNIEDPLPPPSPNNKKIKVDPRRRRKTTEDTTSEEDPKIQAAVEKVDRLWEELQKAEEGNDAAALNAAQKAYHQAVEEHKALTPELPPFRRKPSDSSVKKINTRRAKRWLEARFGKDSAFIFNTLSQIGDDTVHGYVQNGAAYLYSLAEVGTEYHEGFHMFFRTALNDAQRKELFADAVKTYGKPTLAEVSAMKKAYPSLSATEARELVLEEKLAEGFREYTLLQENISTPSRIAKFFSDLWNLIKAMVGSPLSVNQAFSLLESNSIPTKFFRNATSLRPSEQAFRMVDSFKYDLNLYNEIIDSVSTKAIVAIDAITDKKDFNGVLPDDLFGVEGKTGSKLADYYFRNSFSTEEEGPISDEQFQGIKTFLEEDTTDNSDAFNEYLIKENLWGTPHKGKVGNQFILPRQVRGSALHGENMRSIYSSWFSEKDDTGFVIKGGVREEVMRRMKDYGYTVKLSSKMEAVEIDLVTNEEILEKVHSLTSLENNPFKKISQKSKRLLSRIPADESKRRGGSRMGFNTNIPVADVYKIVINASKDSVSFKEMRRNLLKNPKTKAIARVISQFSAEQQSTIYQMALTMRNFNIVQTQLDYQGGTKINIINPNRNSSALTAKDSWKKLSESSQGLYTRDGVSLSINPRKKKKINDNLQVVLDGIAGGQETAPEVLQSLSDLLWDLDIHIGKSKAQTRERVTQFYTDPNILATHRQTVAGLIKSGFGGLNLSKNIEKYILGNTVQNIHTVGSMGKDMQKIAEIFIPVFEEESAGSFQTASNKTMYTVNQKDQHSDVVASVKNGTASRKFAGKAGVETPRTKSVTSNLLLSPKFQKDFHENILDATKQGYNFANDYSSLSEERSLALRMQHWLGRGMKENALISTITHSDRAKMMSFALPKFSQPESRKLYNIKETPAELFRNQMIVDLHRTWKATKDMTENRTAREEGKKAPNKEIENYHYVIDENGVKDYEHPERRSLISQLPVNPSETVDQRLELARQVWEAETRNVEFSEDVKNQLDAHSAHIESMIDSYVNELIDEVVLEDKTFDNENLKNQAIKQWVLENLPQKFTGGQTDLQLFKNFVKDDILGTIAINTLMKGGVQFTKNGIDFIKRQSGSSSPGRHLFMRGEAIGEEMPLQPGEEDNRYGMFETYNKITLKNLSPYNTAIAKKNAKSIGDAYTVKVYNDMVQDASRELEILNPESRAAKLEEFLERAAYLGKAREKEYVAESTNSTDAQSLISIHMWRAIEMGKGEWSLKTDEPQYKKYMEGEPGNRVWGGRAITMVKPVHAGLEEINNELVPVFDKNSYIVVTDELAAGTPLLQDLVARMEKRGVYANETQEVHVVHTEDVEKEVKIGSHSVTYSPGEFADLSVVTLNGKNLRIPQDISASAKERLMTLGRQAKVNMLTNLYDDGTYYINPSLKNEFPITGRELKSLFHQAISRKMDINSKAVLKEFGADKLFRELEKLPTKQDPKVIIKEHNNMMVAMRNKLYAMSEDKGLSENVIAGFETRMTEIGRIDLTVPASFPTVQRSIEQLIFSVFRNQIMRQSISGMEMVQFADFGPSEEGNDLQFLKVDDNRIKHAEVELREDVLRSFGIDANQSLESINEELRRIIGYRIPQQGKNSMLIMKIVKVLPASYEKSIRVPGQITKQMGSDFDIDKMFVMFPELNKQGERINPDYATLLNPNNTAMNQLSEKAVNNVIFDTFEAIASSTLHIDEITEPLGTVEIELAMEELGIEVDSNVDLNNPRTKIKTGVDNMVANSLIGIYANAVSGRNVLIGAGLNNRDLISKAQEFPFIKIDGKTLDNVSTRSKFASPLTGLYPTTDSNIVQFLSAALDAVKSPIHAKINDNALTANLQIYMLSLGMSPTQTIAFMQNPVVLEAVAVAKESINPSLEQAIVGPSKGQTVTEMKSKDLIAWAKGEKKMTPEERKLMQDNLRFFHMNSISLKNLYDMVTPFKVDKKSTMHANIAILDKLNFYSSSYGTGSQERLWGGPSLLNKFITGNAYPSTREYYKHIRKNIQVAEQFGLIGTQPAVTAAKRHILTAVGKGFFNEQEHRDMNYSIAHYIATMPGSPIFNDGVVFDKNGNVTESNPGIMSESTVRRVHLVPEGNIAQNLATIKELSDSGNVAILDLIDPKETNINGRVVHSVTFNAKQSKEASEKNRLSREWELMIYEPALLFPSASPEQLAIVKRFGRDLLTNEIITNEFRPGPSSMFELIPNKMLDDLGISEHQSKILNSLGDATSLSDFTDNFNNSYALRTYGGNTLYPKVNGDPSPSIIKQTFQKHTAIIIEDAATGEAAVYRISTKRMPERGKTYEWVKVVPKGFKGYSELNVRDDRGADPLGRSEGSLALSAVPITNPALSDWTQKVDYSGQPDGVVGVETSEIRSEWNAPGPTLSSIANKTDSTQSLSESENPQPPKIDPTTGQGTLFSKDLGTSAAISESASNSTRKVNKLRRVFANAGIMLNIQFKSLPKGTKGMVQGKEILLDPSQLTEDTVYHEFGHILVDMLPADQRKAYVAMIVKADPVLAEMVRKMYPELTEEQLGTEILVTAIGMEGAKLERQNPSPIQKIINKILRALGKIFGVRPNVAAELAEKMFAGEIRELSLSGVFNTKAQQSRDLNEEISNLSRDALIVLESDIMRLESMPESDMRKKDVRRLQELKKSALRLKEKKDTLSVILELHEHAIVRIDRATRVYNDVRVKMDNSENLSKDEKLELLNNINEIKEVLDSLHGSNNSILKKMESVMNTMSLSEEVGGPISIMRSSLRDSIFDLDRLDLSYRDTVIPLIAETLLTYTNGSVSPKIQALIDHAIANKDITGINRKDPKFRELRASKRNGTLTQEDYNEELLKLKIEQLKNKMPEVQNLIDEMRNAHIDKSAFAMWLDPMVYSTEANIQLFSLALKDAIYQGNARTIEDLHEAEEFYQRFKTFKGGDFNVNEFNKDLLEVLDSRDGSKKILSLVQEYDVKDFYSKRSAMENQIKEETGWPKDAKGGFVYKGSQEFKDWQKTVTELEDGTKRIIYNDGWNQYQAKREKWSSENTVPVKGAQEAIDKINARIDEVNKAIALIGESTLASDKDKLYALYDESSSLAAEKSYSYIYNPNTGGYTFSGRLVKPNKSYRNPKWTAIQDSPELKEYYDYVINKYQEKQKITGTRGLAVNGWDTYSYQMPSVRKSDIERAQKNGLGNTISEQVKSLATVREGEDVEWSMRLDSAGKPSRTVPLYYMSSMDESEVSRDVLSSVLTFGHMSHMFKEKSKMSGLVSGMLNAHETRETTTVSSWGGFARDKVAEKLGFENTKSSRIDPQSKNLRHLQEFIDANFYGMHNKQSSVDIFGQTVDLNKVSGSLTTLTALNSLAGNALQATNQLIFDNMNTHEEAIAGQFFSKSDHAWAVGTYASEGAAIGDLGKFVAKSKLGQAMLMFDAMIDNTESLGKDATNNKSRKLASTNTLFALQHGPEHQTAGVRLLSMMRNMKGKLQDKNGKVLLNEKGEEADLWDMLIKNKKGVLTVDPRVANFSTSQFTNKLHGISKRTNQVKGAFDSPMAKRYPAAKLMLLFRNYFIPGWRKKWGHGDGYHVDHELGDVTRGSYLSFFDMIKNSWSTRTNPFGVYKSMSLVDQQNVKRTMYEMGMWTTMGFLVSALTGMADDDDEATSYAASFGAYQARRLQLELTSFINPIELKKTLDSPTAASNIITKYISLFTHTLSFSAPSVLGFDVADKDLNYQKRSGLNQKGDSKFWAKAGRIVPLLEGWRSTMTPEEKIKWLLM